MYTQISQSRLWMLPESGTRVGTKDTWEERREAGDERREMLDRSWETGDRIFSVQWWAFLTSIVDTSEKFQTGIIDTGDEFLTGIYDTGEESSPVSMIPVKNSSR